MENEHELSYETLTKKILRSYEHYKSVGAEVKLLEPRFTSRGYGMSFIGYKLAWRMWNEVCGAAAFMEKKKEMWPFLGPRMDCGAYKQLMGEGGKMGACVMQVTLHDKRIVMQVTLHYEAIVMQVTLHYEAIVMQVTLHDTRIVMQVTSHYKEIVMQVTLHDKRIVMQVKLHYEAIVMHVTLHDKRIVMQVTLHYKAIVMQVTLHDKRIVMQVTLHYKAIVMQVTLYDEFKQKNSREKVASVVIPLVRNKSGLRAQEGFGQVFLRCFEM
nr:hypothetical protein [Tanacetum cinerariifolium]